MAIEGFIRALRVLTAPEFTWKRRDPHFAAMVVALGELFTVPLYDAAPRDRHNLGRFYAWLQPETSRFIVARTIADAQRRSAEGAALNLDDARTLAAKVLMRFFGVQGASELLHVADAYGLTHSAQAKTIDRDAALLAEAGLGDLDAVIQLSIFAKALASGNDLTRIDPSLAAQTEARRAYVGAHWMYCGSWIQKAFESWLKADLMTAEMQRLLRSMERHD